MYCAKPVGLPAVVAIHRHNCHAFIYDACAMTPSTNQSKVFIRLGSPTSPAGILTLPLLSLMGPAKTCALPALKSLIFASTAAFTSAGTAEPHGASLIMSLL